jgi:surfeit locus 1 family protein
VAKAARGERRGLLTVLAIVGFIILCGLGIWQVQRLGWKTDLIATVETRTHLAPEPAPGPDAWPTLDLGDADYLPVTVAGTFDNSHEADVYVALTEPNGPIGGQGYFVMVPFETDDGWYVIVNRGFVPEENKDPATRLEGQIEGRTEVSGLLRRPQGRNWFTPANDVEADIWFTRDPAAIGEAFGIPADRLAPYYIDAFYDPDLPGGLPQGGETTVSFPNNHLQYAITWFGLAAVLAVMYFLRVLRPWNRARPDQES